MPLHFFSKGKLLQNDESAEKMVDKHERIGQDGKLISKSQITANIQYTIFNFQSSMSGLQLDLAKAAVLSALT